MKSRLPLWAAAAAVIAAWAWAGLLGVYHIAGRASALDRAEAVFADWRLLIAGPRPAPPDVTIVALDDATVAAAGGYPVSRRSLAELIRAIAAGGARVVALDLLLVDSTEADRELARALESLPVVIASAGLFGPDETGRPAVPKTSGEIGPRPEFAAAASVGLANIAADAGGTPRHLPLVFETTEGLAPSFVLQAVSLFLGDAVPLVPGGARVAGEVRPMDIAWHLPLRYYGAHGTLRTISAQSLLDGAEAGLDGQLVLLGATATAVGDRFSVPFDQVMPGVEVLATGIANLLHGSQLVRGGRVRRLDAAVTLALAACGVLAVSLLPLAAGSTVFLGLLAGWAAAAALLFGNGYWFSLALPLAGAVPPVLCLMLVRQMFDRRQAKLQVMARQALGLFHAPALSRRIADDPAFLKSPRAQDAAILFVDLGGFTGTSERLGPAATRDLLKVFHQLVVEEAEQLGGVVLDFMGDGAMIGFGIPDPGAEDAEQALRASFGLASRIRSWIAGSPECQSLKGMRVGVHCGPIILSRLGHERQQQISASGDCVNVASRLMEVGKAHGAAITASSRLLSRAGRTAADLPRPDVTKPVKIRGRRGDIEVVMWMPA